MPSRDSPHRDLVIKVYGLARSLAKSRQKVSTNLSCEAEKLGLKSLPCVFTSRVARLTTLGNKSYWAFSRCLQTTLQSEIATEIFCDILRDKRLKTMRRINA